MISPIQQEIRSKVFDKVIEAKVRMIEYKFMGNKSILSPKEIQEFRKILEEFDRQHRLN